MNLLVWVIYNDYDAVRGVCATAEDCACYLVERGDALLDDDILAYADENNCCQYTTIRRAAQIADKPILDFMVDVLKGNTCYWLPWHIEMERVFGGYDHNLK